MAVAATKFLLLLVLVVFQMNSTPSFASDSCTYRSMFVFGDSLLDTGNLAKLAMGDVLKCPALSSQYGITYFRRPTGRFSNGRLIVDFLARSMKLPLLPPYLSGGDFKHGTNFAVAGATALDKKYYDKLGITINWSNNSLPVQVEWFKQMIRNVSSCPSSAGKRSCDFNKSLFVVGEFGGNDYYRPLTEGESINVTRKRVPLVIKTVSSAIEVVIKHGAKTVLVPGNIPMGCQPAMLTYYSNSSVEVYNSRTGCLDWLNDFSEYHNTLLKEELNRLRLRYSNVTIVYVDYYNAAMSMFNSPKRFGFEKTITACCGTGGGPYNFNLTNRCGSPDTSVCADPSSHVSWDGVHMTEAAYKIITADVLKGLHTSPKLRNLLKGVYTSPQTSHSPM